MKYRTETKKIIHNKYIFEYSTILRWSVFCLSLCPAGLYFVFMDHIWQFFFNKYGYIRQFWGNYRFCPPPTSLLFCLPHQGFPHLCMRHSLYADQVSLGSTWGKTSKCIKQTTLGQNKKILHHQCIAMQWWLTIPHCDLILSTNLFIIVILHLKVILFSLVFPWIHLDIIVLQNTYGWLLSRKKK